MSIPVGTSPTSQQIGRALFPADATGRVLRLTEPVSFWGGVSLDGVVVDARHPQHGLVLTGAVVVMREGRGSSSASSVLAEQIRTGAAPAAIVLAEPDVILALGAMVAQELYGHSIPIVQVSPADLELLPDGALVDIRPTIPPGTVDTVENVPMTLTVNPGPGAAPRAAPGAALAAVRSAASASAGQTGATTPETTASAR